MSNTGLPADLRAAMQTLAEDPDPAPEPFERVARWRRACGDAETAATWQTWSLLPPDPAELREALAALWRGAGELQQATVLLQAAQASTSIQPSWEALALALEQEQLDDAIQLQTRLLETRPNLSVPKLLDLLRLWQQHGQAPQALALLEPLMQWMEQRGEPPSGQLCNIRADLLERLERFDDAEPWWQRSHALQPQQVWPLMRLGHQALRKSQLPLHALQPSSAEPRPIALYAPRLQRIALEARVRPDHWASSMALPRPKPLPPGRTTTPRVLARLPAHRPDRIQQCWASAELVHRASRAPQEGHLSHPPNFG